MTEKKTMDELRKEAKIKAAKADAKKKRIKTGEGYKYYIFTNQSWDSTKHKMYFRHLKSAQQWLDNHMASKQIFAVSDDSVVFTRKDK